MRPDGGALKNLHSINHYLGVCRPPPVASLQRRQPAHPLVSVSGLLGDVGAFELPLINRHLGVCRPPPVASLQRRQPAHPLVSVSVRCWWACRWRASIACAAPMVGASPDNIGAQRLAEGGVSASGAGSEKLDADHHYLTPITAVAANARCAPPAGGGWRRVCSGRR